MFLDLTQLYLDPPVLDTVNFLKRQGQTLLDGAVITDRKVFEYRLCVYPGKGSRRGL